MERENCDTRSEFGLRKSPVPVRGCDNFGIRSLTRSACESLCRERNQTGASALPPPSLPPGKMTESQILMNLFNEYLKGFFPRPSVCVKKKVNSPLINF